MLAVGVPGVTGYDGKYDETTCYIVSTDGPKENTHSSRNGKTYKCDHKVVTDLYGNSTEFDLEGGAVSDSSCSVFGTSCDYNKKRDCSGSCFVREEPDGELAATTWPREAAVGVSIGLVVGGAVALCCFLIC